MGKEQKKITSRPKTARTHQVSFRLNDEEYNAIRHYMARYRIGNRANWYRTTLLTHVLKVLEKDYPTLFNEYEMRR
jgi:hypothetical protein